MLYQTLTGIPNNFRLNYHFNDLFFKRAFNNTTMSVNQLKKNYCFYMLKLTLLFFK